MRIRRARFTLIEPCYYTLSTNYSFINAFL